MKSAAAATPGKWNARPCKVRECWCASIVVDGVDEDGDCVAPTGSLSAKDAEYIARMNPQTAVALVAEIRRLQREVELLQDELEL